MPRRGKKRSKQGQTSSNQQQQQQHRSTPKVVDHVTESDDEEIDEDEAFNSEDERMYGHFFVKSKNTKSNASYNSDGDDEDNDDDEEVSSDDENEQSENDDDDDDDNDEDADDEDDDDDDGQYMLSLLDKLDSANNSSEKKSTLGRSSSSSGLAPLSKVSESEYSSAMASKNGSALTVSDLMEGLEDTQGFKTLQKTFAKQQTATPAPLDRVVADRTQRKMVYEEEKKDISRWTKVVQENRQAETLDFKPKERVNLTRDTLVAKFEPTTDFEKELDQALEQAGQQDEEAVLKAEEQALQDDLGANRLTMEEYKKRRGQLAQVRALMFYHEQKRNHIKKIKSKKYRSIRKKQRERLKNSALEAAMEEDDELANELKEKEEVSRIQERMTLAHKNTSKWAKRILKRGKNVDVETRRALSAQLKRGDDLRRKMLGDESGASDNDDSDEDLVKTARKVLEDTSESADPTKGKTGLFKLSFMQKGLQKQRDLAREEARRLLSELQANEEAGDDFEETAGDTSTWGVPPAKKEKMASEKEMSNVLQKGEMVVRPLEFGNSNAISTSGGIEIDISSGTNPSGHVMQVNSRSTTSESNLEIQASSTTQTDSQNQTKEKDSKANARGAKHAAKENKKASAPQNVVEKQDDDDDENPWLQSTTDDQDAPAPKSTIARQRKSKKGFVDIDGAVDILDSTANGMEKKNNRNDKAAKVVETTITLQENNGKDTNEKKLTSMTQEELVKRAFASASDKDIEDEFAKEKEEMANENDPTRKNVGNGKGSEKVVAGWGSWTGTGAPAPPPPRRSKFPNKFQPPEKKKKEETKKRKDEDKPNVIINQKRLKRMANTYMLGDIPHPYSSREEYEQFMVGGMGQEWNVTGAFKSMTRPEILTRSGKIIQPISKKAKVARAPAKF